MKKLIARGIDVLRREGPVVFAVEVANFLDSKRFPFIQRVDQFAKRRPLLGAVVVPLYCLLNGFLVVKRGAFYVRYSARRNIFGTRRLYVVDLETVSKGEGVERRYFSYLNCPLEPTDTVLDIGAARGMTTAVAARTAARVVAVEPSPRMFTCLSKNVDADNVEIHQLAMWNEPGERELHYGRFSKDDSLLEPDAGGSGVSTTVRTDTVEHFATEHGIERIDFLKIEAEGAEPEVIEGIGDVEVEKIVVNCSPERGGESPAEEVTQMLTRMGYTVDSAADGYEVFAWKGDRRSARSRRPGAS